MVVLVVNNDNSPLLGPERIVRSNSERTDVFRLASLIKFVDFAEFVEALVQVFALEDDFRVVGPFDDDVDTQGV